MNSGNFAAFALVLTIMSVCYWLVQNSDPGYLTDIIAPDVAVEWSSDAFRAVEWKGEWGDEDDGTWDDQVKHIMEARTKFTDLDTKDSDGVNNGAGDEDEDDTRRVQPTGRGTGKNGSRMHGIGSSGGGDVEYGASGGTFLTADEPEAEETSNEFENLLTVGKPLVHRIKIDTKHPDLPYRAIYCKQERRWVAMFDHYCGVLGTPIGEKNHSRFWWYLFVQLQALCYAVGIVHSGFQNNVIASKWYGINAHALWTAIVLYILVIFVGSLWGFHTWLALTNTTSYEFMRNDRIDYLRGTKDFDLPYSAGVVNNLRMFCCNDGLLARMRGYEWEPVQWGKPKAFTRDGEWTDNIWENKHWSCC